MSNRMIEFKMSPYTKCIALKVTPFESEIIDERNFSCDDEQGLIDFEEQYCCLDDCVVARVEM